MQPASYSQYGEDVFIQALIQDYEPRVVVDVGANDGQSWSNSRLFGLLGYRLLLIEPMPEYADRCRALYAGNPDVMIENVAVTAETGIVEFHINMDIATDELAMRSSLMRSMVPGDNVKTIRVPGEPLQAILVRQDIPHEFGLLNVDAEGLDLTVLRSLDLQVFRPRVICIEGGTAGGEIEQHLENNGYRRVTILGVNGIYARVTQDADTDESASIAIGSGPATAVDISADNLEVTRRRAEKDLPSTNLDSLISELDISVDSAEAENNLLVAAADELHELARSLNECGHTDAGDHLYSAAAALDRVVTPQPSWWMSAFNGQDARSRLFVRMIELLEPAAIVETGTFRGTTTAFIAQHFSGRIFTSEIDRRWYLAAQTNLAKFPQIDIRLQDSREFLETIDREIDGDMVLYYLDAHWSDDLPLINEIDIIFSQKKSSVIMIDDFAVPFDAGYKFDDYGPGKALTLDLLAQVNPREASLFFPTLPAHQETGAQRGCAVIGIGRAAQVLTALPELRRHDWPSSASARSIMEPTVRPSPNRKPLQRLVCARHITTGLATARTEIDRLRCERDAIELGLQSTEASLKAARSEANEYREYAAKEISNLRGCVTNLAGMCAHLRAEIASLRTSTSWKITAPLRGMRRILGRFTSLGE